MDPEKVPEKFDDLPEDHPPERARAIKEFDRIIQDVAAWEREHPQASKSTLLHQSIPKACSTESIEKLTARLRWFLDNEATRRDFNDSIGSNAEATEPAFRPRFLHWAPRKEPAMVQTAIGARFKTGQTCVESGRYRFDGYVDGTSSAPPTTEEREIPLSRNETFPPVRSVNKGCWWKLVSRI